MPSGEVGKSNTIFQFSLLNILYLPIPYSWSHFAYFIATRLLSFLSIKRLHIGRENVGVTKIELRRFIDSSRVRRTCYGKLLDCYKPYA